MKKDVLIKKIDYIIGLEKDGKISEKLEKVQELLNIKNNFSKIAWKYIAENKKISEDLANNFIIRKDRLGKPNERGLDFLILMYNQQYTEEFYNQDYIKELLNIDEDYYHKKMGVYNSYTTDGNLWCNLFVSHQWFFSEKFLLENIENYIGTYDFQEYQEVSMDIYEKYIDDDRLRFINCYDQNIPSWFFKKHIPKYLDKINISDCYYIKGLDEETFVEFLSYPEIYNDKERLDTLWLSVGVFNISEKFIKENIDKINDKYDKIFNMVKTPWDFIMMNQVEYSIELIKENIKNINLDYLFKKNILRSNGKTITKEMILEFGPKNKEEYFDTEVLNTPIIKEMDNYVENLLDNGIVNFEILGRSKHLSINLVEKYKDDLHLEKVCHYNRNINIDFFKNKILEWEPDFEIAIDTYVRIDNLSEKNFDFFINEYYKKFDEEEIKIYFYILENVIENRKDNYSDEIKQFIKNLEDNKKFNFVKPKHDKIANINDIYFGLKYVILDIVNNYIE